MNSVAKIDLAKQLLPAGKKLFISHSKLETFLKCPKRYMYQYVLKYPQPKTIPLMYGSAIHEAIAVVGANLQIFKRTGDSKYVDNDYLLRESMDKLRDEWDANMFPTQTLSDSRYDVARKSLWYFIQQEVDLVTQQYPHMIESKFFFRIPNTSITINGIFDRVDKSSSGDSTIIREFKTSLNVFAKEAGVRQVELYALVYDMLNGVSPSSLSLEEVGSDTKLEINAQNTIDNPAPVWERVFSVANGIVNEEFDAKPSPTTCRLCPFSEKCDSAL